MNEMLANNFLSTAIGKEWIKTKDYSDLYSCLGRFCSIHLTGYNVPDPTPIAESIKSIVEAGNE